MTGWYAAAAMRRFWVFLASVVPLACASAPRPAPSTTPSGPPPTGIDAQVEAGAKSYESACAGCHGKTGKGGNRAPGIIGKKALGKNARETFVYIKDNMPPDGPGPLTEQDYLNITAWLVKQDGWTVTEPITAANADSVKP